MSNILPTKEKNKIAGMIKETFTPTGNYEQDKLRAEEYSKRVGMDNTNTKMAVIAATEGFNVAAKTMINEFTDSNGNLDYAAMRSRYG